MNWYKQGKDEVLKNLGTSIDKGLTDFQVDKGLDKYGKNELIEAPKEGLLSKEHWSPLLIRVIF